MPRTGTISLPSFKNIINSEEIDQQRVNNNPEVKFRKDVVNALKSLVAAQMLSQDLHQGSQLSSHAEATLDNTFLCPTRLKMALPLLDRKYKLLGLRIAKRAAEILLDPNNTQKYVVLRQLAEKKGNPFFMLALLSHLQPALKELQENQNKVRPPALCGTLY